MKMGLFAKKYTKGGTAMLRKILESDLRPMADTEFYKVLDLVTSDIKTNRVDFGKRTSLSGMVEIAWISLNVLGRGKVA